ncbi:MAG TPA: hypothetical protein VGF97_17835 [Rhizomicrobium sp.]|jgi:hypothetical protein
MQAPMPECADWNWSEMLDAFRSLGGVAENVVPGRGVTHRGLSPADPSQPVLLRVPQNLLFRSADVEFVGDGMRIRDSAGASEAARDFFARYESAFSWGAEGKSESLEVIRALDALPPEIRAALMEEFDFGDVLEGDFTTRCQNRFLRSRELLWANTPCIAPVIELANLDASGLACEQTESCVEIAGHVSDEVLVSCADHDAFSMFRKSGCSSREPVAFSLPMQLKLGDREIVIRRNRHEAIKRGPDRVPITISAGGKIELSYLMIGHAKFPRLSRGILRTLLREAGMQGADEAFDCILRLNTMKFIKLLRACEPHRSETISHLRRAARFQLEAMTCCIGSRELEPVS